MELQKKSLPGADAPRVKRGRGQGFVEYAMIMALIGLGLTAALFAFRDQLSSALSTVGAGL